jgi:hypothetical protein
MKTLSSKTMLAVLFALLPLARTAQAANISGTIATTMTITGNNELTGNVNCTVTSGSCIVFGAKNTQLHLNGFVITGNNGSLIACTASTNVSAIDTAKFDDAKIHGRGLITEFTGNGIVLSGSNSEIHEVAITSVCFNGVVVSDGGDNNVNANRSQRNSRPGRREQSNSAKRHHGWQWIRNNRGIR